MLNAKSANKYIVRIIVGTTKENSIFDFTFVLKTTIKESETNATEAVIKDAKIPKKTVKQSKRILIIFF